ncbi:MULTISPECIES: ABC transporter permease [unclassified Microbacterium]|uniref:ABC transporter permease n=1 Tax=unclassified Microbacterium TaxID=2609290 RepID=UPI00214B888F|nr:MULTISPECIES: ABC transporter permease [unclassified Microbacterium]MCR2783218.1 ABC transporter permease [Microbacterium sp. zg.B96]MDL5351998.1 ABC transporter permease [Microbacterium sp. zg-YB36]WIM15903.1 ABC transporter permease [Microbacterium sp. zg-B96]
MSTSAPAPTTLGALTTRRRRRGGGFFSAPSGWISIGVLVVFVLTAVFGPMIIERPAGLGTDILQPPSFSHWFGTDDLGQDVFAQVVWGTRVSLLVGGAASLIAIVIGTGLGLLGAYVRRLDPIVTTLTDVMLSLPMLPLMILVTALAGPSVLTLTVVIGVLSWAEVARLIRSNALVVSSMPYIDGARVLGAKPLRILGTELLPAVMPLVIVSVLLQAARAVISEAGLSFLGMGDPNTWSWGRILLNAQRSGVIATAWWQTLFPSLAILVLVLAATVAGIRYNDSRDPRLREA